MARASMTGTWGHAGTRCKQGSKEGEAVVYFRADKTMWTVVLWDGEPTPVCVPYASLLYKPLGERSFTKPNPR